MLKLRYHLRAKRLWVFAVIFALIQLSCSIVEVVQVPSNSSPSGIIFVTVTPTREIVLNESLRSRSMPAEPQTNPAPYFADANELGQVMVLEYHRLAYPELRFQRTPANFRADLQRLYQAGYYPVNFVDLIRGLPDVPAGKKPIVLTFDDSDISQFRVLDDNTIDADSAVGIMLNFHDQHPDWPTRATFFVLGSDNADHISIFGQPKWAQAKVQLLVEQGMEIGSHTVNHVNLAAITAERIEWELAVSQHVIEELAPGYEVETLSVPYGEFPYTLDFLKGGKWGNYSYTYSGNAAAWGGPTISPYDSTFDPYRVSRLEVTSDALNYWLTHFEQNPHAYYVSDGDPKRITMPEQETVVSD